jgi:membrane-associated phospholipid phosphatase
MTEKQHALELKIRKSDRSTVKNRPWMLTGAASALWITTVIAREKYIPWACDRPGACPKVTIFNPIDQWATLFPSHWSHADFLSEVTQAAAGVSTLLTVALGCAHLKGRQTLAQIAEGARRLLLATALNGMLMEATRMVVKRPRPTVNPDSLKWLAIEPKATYYTSFYSGHTSFAFVSATLTFIFLKELMGDPKSIFRVKSLRTSWIVLVSLIAVATAVLRVMAHRHYLSDVTVGALLGVTATLIANRLDLKF